MFKKGDFIKIKSNTKLESGEIVNDWAGEIQAVYQKEKTCLVILDAQTIDSFDDAYLKDCIEEGAEPFEYVFELNDLEFSEKRNSYEEELESLDRLAARMVTLEKEDEAEQEEIKIDWTKEFINSYYYESLNEIQKEHSRFISGTFLDYMRDYEGVQPSEWTTSNVKSVCLDIVPRKISSEIETFENYGDVLIQFLEFLQDKNYIQNAVELIQEVSKIKSQIPIEARNPNNWGMAKSMMMSALESGVDLGDEGDMKKFMMLKQLEALNQINEETEKKIIPLRADPYKGIGRNQKITVKYDDGKVLENVKFKKVESDLRKGNCELL